MSSATASLPALKKILVATDFSQCSHHALEYGLRLARGLDATLDLTHVISSANLALAGPQALGFAGDAAWRDLTELEHALECSGALSGIPHHLHLAQGDICAQLERIVDEDDIDLVVVGTHGRAGMMKIVAGSVAENIFRRISCPVLVIGPKCAIKNEDGEKLIAERVLLATDFGAASRHAIPYAAAIANQAQGKLILLHVIPPLALTSADSFWYLGPQLEGMKKALQTQTTEQLRKLVPQELGFTEPEFVTEVDFPVDGILRSASKHHADVIVLGLRGGPSRAASHNPWEIADRVICGATVPVLTVKA